MRLSEVATRSFARHETFHPRFGWFRKAYAVAAADPDAFGRSDAPAVIGVGKNMVRAIRFWGLAAKLITEHPHSPNRRSPQLVPTRRGHALFGEHGWDRYMEDPGTLWLLHWLLLAPPTRLPVWWLAFNEFSAVEFDDDDLTDAVLAQLEAEAEWSMPHESSVRKDISALMRTYAPAEATRRISIDDVLDCPMRELRLLDRSPATGLRRFTLGRKASLPSAVAAYAVLDYMDRTGSGGRTVTLSRLAYEAGSPGRAFKLNETEMLAVLQPAVDQHGELSLAAPAGAWQFACSGDPEIAASGVLDSYFRSSREDETARATGASGSRTAPVGGCIGDLALDDDELRKLNSDRYSPQSSFGLTTPKVA